MVQYSCNFDDAGISLPQITPAEKVNTAEDYFIRNYLMDTEITILMLCLDEEETIERYIKKAQYWIKSSGVSAKF